ncbi:MAG: efflux RND transporter permease subunit [Candidatus Izemoplasmataceae bacterium]
MKGLINFSVQKAITVFMVVIAVSIFGVVSFTRLTTDLFPNVNVPFAVVITQYPGATPDEVESQVSVPLESVFQTTTNIEQVTSMSSENVSTVVLEFNASADMDSAIIEMRENLNLVLDTLPDEASNPIIIRLNPDLLPVMTFSVTYEGKDLQALTEWVDDELTPRIERVPGVASLSISGGYDSEIRVMLDQEAIDDYNNLIPDEMDFEIDKDVIEGLLTAQNFAFPAGFVKVEGVDYLVRVGDGISSFEEVENLVLFDLGFPGGKLTLSDIATVTYAPANEQVYSKVNGENALTITIQKQSDFATTDVTEAINATLSEILSEDDQVGITTLLDQGEYIESATSSVVNNIIIGAALAIIILFIFLRSFRVTFIVGVAIPISLLFAVVLIYLSGITLNLVSLGGLALGIGMLVDNSIVVMENIFRLKKQGASNKEAAIKGTYQVAGAITASTLTTIGVFLPVMFIEDFIREIFYQLALTVTFSLIASLGIALTLVPSISTKVLNEDETLDDTNETSSFSKIKAIYTKILEGFFKVKYVAIFAVLALFVGSIYLATSNGFEFFPASDEGTLNVTLEIDPNEPVTFDEFTESLDDLYEDLSAYDDIETVGISLGSGNFNLMQNSTDSANLNIVLKQDRTLSTQAMSDEITNILETNYSDFVFEITGTQGDISALTGSGIQLELKGPDLTVLREQADLLAAELDGIEGIEEIDKGFGRETQEIKITVDKDEAIKYGLTVGQILEFFGNYLSGPSAIGSVNINAHTYDITVYDEGETDREDINDLDSLRNLVVGQTLDPLDPQPVLLSDVAEVTVEPGFASINRVDGSRALTMDATLESGYNATLVSEDVAEVVEDYDLPTGYEINILGESEETMNALTNLLLAGVLAIAIVYMIMASQFQSLTYPFIIMITIPLAFTGGFMVLFMFDLPVSIVAVIGLIILAGVVVNNGIVLVDYINQLREEGYELKEAIYEAGRIRLRPIFMTALTTILALMGLALGLGEGSELIQPIGLTAVAGLIYATFLTIFIVPLMYDIVTRKGRYIFGAFFALSALAAAIYFTLSSLALALGFYTLTIIIILLMIFLPKRKKEDKVTINDDHFDDLIKKVIN